MATPEAVTSSRMSVILGAVGALFLLAALGSSAFDAGRAVWWWPDRVVAAVFLVESLCSVGAGVILGLAGLTVTWRWRQAVVGLALNGLVAVGWVAVLAAGPY